MAVPEESVSAARASIDRAADVLASVRNKGVKLWSENGQLHFEAPKGVLTQEDIGKLRISKSEIIALLQGPHGGEIVPPMPASSHAPLAFSQLWHWNSYRLHERHAIRQIAAATRLRGRLNIEVLRKSITEVSRRHDALRIRIVLVDGNPMQEVLAPTECELAIDDLTGISAAARESELMRIIDAHILEPIDPTVGPLFGARLVKIRDNEHVLIVAMEHMISDGFSLGIVSGEILTSYQQVLAQGTVSLPPIALQFPEYAARQRGSLRAWLEKHGAYWNEHLQGCPRLRFPDDVHLPEKIGWGVVPVRIGLDLKTRLREWCRARRTTLAMSAFIAYVALVLRWCNARQCIIQYQSDGRNIPEIQSTVGFFAAVLYLRMELHEGVSFATLLSRATDEYCKAYENVDFSYFSAQVPRPEFTYNSAFNWVPRGPKLGNLAAEGALTCSAIDFVPPLSRNLEIDGEPSLVLFDCEGGEIDGELWFPLKRFSVEPMERFARNFLVFIEALLSRPDGHVMDISLV